MNDLSRQIILRETNWYFDESDEFDDTISYKIFREVIADHVNLQTNQIGLVGSSVFGFSLSPKDDKTFKTFHPNSDLDLIIISETLFRALWKALLEAYHLGYSWVMQRHANEIFRKFTLLINNGNYKTNEFIEMYREGASSRTRSRASRNARIKALINAVS